MILFDFDEYKIYLEKRLSLMPKAGRGEVQKMAQALRMHSTRFSHILRGQEHFTLEQGLSLTRYLGLNQLESEYFLLLLQEAKAGTKDLESFFFEQRKKLKERSKELSERVPGERKLSESEKALFYSNWYYSAIRLFCSLPGRHTVDEISERFSIPRSRASQAIEFLLHHGLCVSDDQGLHMGPKSTHLESTSPIVSRLHSNWRIKAMERHPSLLQTELAFTSPMSLEAKDVAQIRELLVQMIERATKYADTDHPDALYCLNVDFFGF